MMHDFLVAHRDELVARCKAKVAARPARSASAKQMAGGIPLFLEQLTRTLAAERVDQDARSLEISGPSGGAPPASSEIGVGATAHGKALLELDYTVDQVVHDYGDLCQAITELALERRAPFAVTEFKTLNRCLDNAIADAVTEFSRQRDVVRSDARAAEASERLAFLLHELRNALHTSNLAILAIQQGSLSLCGATGTVLKRSLAVMHELVDGSIAEVRATHRAQAQRAVFAVAAFIEEARVGAQLEAEARHCDFAVSAVDPALRVHADRALLHGVLTNLLVNAFKYTHRGTAVHLNVHETQGQVHIDVEDRCGGLPSGFDLGPSTTPVHAGHDKTGLGIGLSIARQTLEAMGGTLSFEDLAGVGCIFTIQLPAVTDAAPACPA
ncbi:sensor histidine kinase [Rubrivivax sp. RP6-9]|uniref:sensor histidine kinase n=1 Tax=Rubrivivax sp. RP6-9 TaxID=3415750 RepID=UPI003CC55821